jgi:hypothetical protein
MPAIDVTMISGAFTDLEADRQWLVRCPSVLNRYNYAPTV